jgi:cytochrome c5
VSRLALVTAAALLVPATGWAEPAMPSPPDPRLARLWASSCQSCHAAPGAGAPVAHDPAVWTSRWRKGEAELLDNVVTGYNGMPSNGGCAGCTLDDLRALIRFMARPEPAK